MLDNDGVGFHLAHPMMRRNKNHLHIDITSQKLYCFPVAAMQQETEANHAKK
jgi:hypothetical protein